MRSQYKFIVDGDWKYAPDQPAMYDEDNNVNNVLEVQEYVPENLASLSSFDLPPSPPERRGTPHAKLPRCSDRCRVCAREACLAVFHSFHHPQACRSPATAETTSGSHPDAYHGKRAEPYSVFQALSTQSL